MEINTTYHRPHRKCKQWFQWRFCTLFVLTRNNEDDQGYLIFNNFDERNLLDLDLVSTTDTHVRFFSSPRAEMPNFSQKRVAPVEDSSDIVEIRPTRYLRIQHFNARPRDDQFDKEMEIFMQYKKTGIPSSGPMTMSKRFTRNPLYPSSRTSHLPVQGNTGSVTVNTDKVICHKEIIRTSEIVKEDLPSSSIAEDDIPSSYANPSLSSSVFSSPCHTVSDKIQSASSVVVALHMSQQKNLCDQQNHTTDSSTAKLKSDSPLFKKTANKDQKTHLENCQTPVSGLNDTHVQSGVISNKGPSQNELNQSEIPKQVLNCRGNASSNSSDTVLFFIHGVGGSSDIWCSQIQHFAQKGYEIIAPDLIGHGFSCCPKNAGAYHFKEIAADIEDIFDKYCKKKNVVVGHSYGASFATLLARTRSRRIYKLVLISSGPPTPLAPQPGVFTLPTCLLGCIKPCLVCCFKKGAFHKKRKPVIPKRNAFSVPTNVLQHMMNGQDWPDGDELYHNWLTCPCLLIYGEEDQLVSFEDERDTQRAIFNSRLEVVKEASHMVMMEAPNEVNGLLENFIEQTINNENQDHQGSTTTEPVLLTSSFKRQKSVISLKSHVPQKSHSPT